jgi:hypothetical protein
VGPFRLNKRDVLWRWLTNAVNQGGPGAYRTIKARFTLHTQLYDHIGVSILNVETVRTLDPDVEADGQLLAAVDNLYKGFYKKYQHRIAVNTPNSMYWEKKADQLWRTMITKVGCCAYCGATEHLEAHHLISRSNSSMRHDVDCGLCLCRYHHLYCPHISPHRNQQTFEQWLKESLPQKYRWLQEYSQLEYQLTANYKEAFLRLSHHHRGVIFLVITIFVLKNVLANSVDTSSRLLAQVNLII